jgi:MFS family permease
MGEFSELWMLGMILAAFAGGAFGSAIGALPAFIFTGFLVMAGETAAILSADFIALTDFVGGDLQSDAITGQIAFGPVFGPHISFAAGAAASAFAAKKGYMATGFPYHEAKNIAYAQGPKPDVLFVGGLFGILGYWITTISVTLSLPWDPIAIAVVLSALIHRAVFGYSVIGKADKGYFNMAPFEKGERRGASTEAVEETDEEKQGRLLVEPWLPHQYKWSDVTMLGIVVGILAAYITYETGSVFLPFGISAASLLFLNLGVANIPVTHHISLVASTAMVAISGGAFMDMSLSLMLLTGAGFGILAALFGEIIQRIFYSHADTHFDPPAAAIVIGTFIIAILAIAGVIPSSAWVPLPF